MKLHFIVATLLLSGCSSMGQTNAVRDQGSMTSERRSALDDCQVKAIGKAPQAISTRNAAGAHHPAHLFCVGTGPNLSCGKSDAYNDAGIVTTVDVNQRLRERLVDRCMKAKGF